MMNRSLAIVVFICAKKEEVNMDAVTAWEKRPILQMELEVNSFKF